ncbi:MAG TPA: hypothetical protein VFO95_01095, partial [Gemmatimonadales bacterium]|nr:hypothetical protein [Gemmatimonadales bacterium]
MTLPLQLDSGTTTSLPDDFARDLGRRVTLAGLSLGGLWTLVALLQRLTLGWGGRNPLTYAAWDRFGGVLSAGVVGASLLLAWAGRRLRNRPRSMLRLVLGYELLIAAAVALISQWHPPDAARGISWNCLVILLFPALAPARPALILMTSLLVATAEPLMYALAVRAGVADPPLPAHQLFWSFAPAYLCAFLAVIPAAVLRRLGTALREARELGNYRLGERIGAGGMG